MTNQYVFIIWNKALFAKDRIIDDLNKSFDIKKRFYIKWSKDKFYNNLVALYGYKCSNPKEKSIAIGKGKFLVVVIKDNNPIFDKRELQHKLEMVNSKVYDKKWLYRKWTADNFRIHSSISDEETIHDLSILLSNDYKKVLDNIEDNEVINVDASDIYNNIGIKISNKLNYKRIIKDFIKYILVRIF